MAKPAVWPGAVYSCGSAHATHSGRRQARHGAAQSTTVKAAAGKTGACPWINRKIIGAADAGDVRTLISTIEAHMSEMNLVNLSTSLHRLAKLSASDSSAQHALQHHPIMASVRSAISVTLVNMGIDRTLPQALSNVAWSMATLRYSDPVLLELVGSRSAMNMQSFKPFELSSLLWAFAKLANFDSMTSSFRTLFKSAATHLMTSMKDMQFRSLATSAWAFATAKQSHHRLFCSLAEEMRGSAPSANCQEMANTVWAFATAAHRDDELFFTIAETAVKRMGEFKAQEVANMMWGFAGCDFFHEAFFTQALHATQHLPMNAQHLANVLWACARLKPHHPATKQATLALLPRCIGLSATFKPQELSSVAMAVAKVFGIEDYSEDVVSWRASQSRESLHPQVLAFFTAVTPHILANLHGYSVQSLTNMASALARLDMGAKILPAIEQEILCRIDSLEIPLMCQLVRALLPTPGACSRQAIPALATKLVNQWHSLRHKDKRVLMMARVQQQQSIVYDAALLEGEADSYSEDLHKWCLSLASSGSSSLPEDVPEGQFPRSPEAGLPLVQVSDYYRNDASGDGDEVQECEEDILTDDEMPYATWDDAYTTRQGRLAIQPPICVSASGGYAGGRCLAARDAVVQAAPCVMAQAPPNCLPGTRAADLQLSTEVHPTCWATPSKPQAPIALAANLIPRQGNGQGDVAVLPIPPRANAPLVVPTACRRVPNPPVLAPHFGYCAGPVAKMVAVPDACQTAVPGAPIATAFELARPESAVPMPVPRLQLASVQEMQTLSTDAPPSLAKPWQCSVKNSFLHVWADGDKDIRDESTHESTFCPDGGSSQRSTSAPSRVSFDEAPWAEDSASTMHHLQHLEQLNGFDDSNPVASQQITAHSNLVFQPSRRPFSRANAIAGGSFKVQRSTGQGQPNLGLMNIGLGEQDTLHGVQLRQLFSSCSVPVAQVRRMQTDEGTSGEHRSMGRRSSDGSCV